MRRSNMFNWLLVEFMELKNEFLRNLEGYPSWVKYFTSSDKEAILSWGSFTAMDVFNTLKTNILHDEETYGLGTETCPFCINHFPNCSVCEYANYHGECVNEESSDYYTISEYLGDIMFQYPSHEDYLEIIGKIERKADLLKSILDNNFKIDGNILNSYPEAVFVFGDNTLRKGKKGGATLRDFKNSYGFITKKYPSYKDDAYFKPEEYEEIFNKELDKLKGYIVNNSNKFFLISKIGSGLANKYGIWEEVIFHGLLKLEQEFPKRVLLLWC